MLNEINAAELVDDGLPFHNDPLDDVLPLSP